MKKITEQLREVRVCAYMAAEAAADEVGRRHLDRRFWDEDLEAWAEEAWVEGRHALPRVLHDEFIGVFVQEFTLRHDAILESVEVSGTVCSASASLAGGAYAEEVTS